ncbi:YARHG domain-containing protein [Xanthobacter autotrophicus]|uniref:YARHG domain-containing protein n=1 Tax=Xanthobacter autotrophicus TaxID=280 RepID=UPI0024A6A3D1|nr:YARHG domain-containing protein [Xanthobacter autotrophicus]MDI4656747.1 YARHG domain-containing protein [Xanthobacter autotrophicus]
MQKTGLLFGAVAGALLALAPAAQAQTLGELSCRALWYQRNSVYAERGYCFKTADAVATFGERCFPPYGQLTPSQQRFVDEVKAWEARKGCR